LPLGLKLAAVAVAVALLGLPLAEASVCWEMSTATAACPGHCPMPEKPAHPSPVKERVSDPGCCEISSSEPAPLATVAVSFQNTTTPDLTPVSLAAATAERVAGPVPKESPPFHAASSLNTLYCVFLI